LKEQLTAALFIIPSATPPFVAAPPARDDVNREDDHDEQSDEPEG
jgi:hypothetical protein